MPNSPTTTPTQLREIPILTTINGALSQINIAIPLVIFAVTQFYQLLRRDNPNMTEAEYIEYLRTQGRTVAQFSETWLVAHGYAKDDAGHWTKVQT
jgi:hypothetical protein